MKFEEKTKNQLFFALSTFSFVLIDQLSKYLIRTSGGFYICNTGVAFGIAVPKILIIIFFLIITSIIFLALKNKKTEMGDKPNFFSLILIFSGALSNIIDRLYFGCVFDFIDLLIWPVFNLADTFITIGVMILIYKIIKKQTSNQN